MIRYFIDTNESEIVFNQLMFFYIKDYLNGIVLIASAYDFTAKLRSLSSGIPLQKTTTIYK